MNHEHENFDNHDRENRTDNPSDSIEKRTADNRFSHAGGQGGYQNDPYQEPPVYHYDPSRGFTLEPQRKKKSGRGKAALLLAGCMAFSALFGFGGGVAAMKLMGQNQTVLYRPAENTVSDSGAAAQGTALSTSEIAALAANSVVEITTESTRSDFWLQQYVQEGAGSGVIFSSDGYIVTNNHVISGANKITVRLKNGESYDAKLIGTDAKTDVAVVKIEAENLQPAVLGSSADLQVGEFALAIGNPLGSLGGTVTDGIISALNRDIIIDGETMNLLQTNAAVNPGNSGGGLFNERGELIGIINAKSSGSNVEGLGFAIPIDTVKTVFEQLVTNGYVSGRAALGVSVIEISDAQTAMQHRVQRYGVYVVAVTPGEAAERAGIEAGDCIASIDGTVVSSLSDLKAELSNHSVGDTIKVGVIRGNKMADFDVTLTEQKPAE